MTLNSDQTVAVDPQYKWIKIDGNTPRGVKLQLINKAHGVAFYGPWINGSDVTHYQLLPTFDKDEPQ